MQPHPHCAAPHTRTVRKKCARTWPNFYKNGSSWETKFVLYRPFWLNFHLVNCQKTVPPYDLEVHQNKAPSIGQSSHGWAIPCRVISGYWHFFMEVQFLSLLYILVIKYYIYSLHEQFRHLCFFYPNFREWGLALQVWRPCAYFSFWSISDNQSFMPSHN